MSPSSVSGIVLTYFRFSLSSHSATSPPQLVQCQPTSDSAFGLPPPPSVPASSLLAGATPIAPYVGLRAPEQGSANDRRVASAQRARAGPSNVASGAVNNPRIRVAGQVNSDAGPSSSSAPHASPSVSSSSGSAPLTQWAAFFIPYRVSTLICISHSSPYDDFAFLTRPC